MAEKSDDNTDFELSGIFHDSMQSRACAGQGSGENRFPEGGEDSTEKEESTESKIEVAKPELTTNLSGSVTYKKGDTAEPLTVEATSSDGGTITYQWYKSQTNTNGGGTVIEGETENTFTPSTQEEGTMYYYAVAISTIENSTNRVTSDTKEVIVTADAEAQPAEEAQGDEQPAQ